MIENSETKVIAPSLDKVLKVLWRHRVYSHYRATAAERSARYCVFATRPDGSSEQVSEPKGHKESCQIRDQLIAEEMIALFAGGTGGHPR